MKFRIPLLLILLSCAAASCLKQRSSQKSVTVTIEPQRYFAEKIAGNHIAINCIVPPGNSPETFDPTPSHLVNLEKSEAYFKIGYLGFEMAWLDKLAQNNPHLLIFDNSKGVALLDDGHVCNDEPLHIHSENGFDPHIWSSPKQARIIARNMLDAFVTIDPEHEKAFRANYDTLIMEIDRVDSTLTALLPRDQKITFAIYHPSLSYFARDYGLQQLSIELNGKEPSPQYFADLIRKAREEEVSIVFVQQEFDRRNVESFAKELGCNIYEINPLNYNWSDELLRLATLIRRETPNRD